MLDDLVELAVDIGAEVLGAVVEHRAKRAKEKKNVDREKDPWEQKDKRLPWEE